MLKQQERVCTVLCGKQKLQNPNLYCSMNPINPSLRTTPHDKTHKPQVATK